MDVDAVAREALREALSCYGIGGAEPRGLAVGCIASAMRRAVLDCAEERAFLARGPRPEVRDLVAAGEELLGLLSHLLHAVPSVRDAGLSMREMDEATLRMARAMARGRAAL